MATWRSGRVALRRSEAHRDLSVLRGVDGVFGPRRRKNCACIGSQRARSGHQRGRSGLQRGRSGLQRGRSGHQRVRSGLQRGRSGLQRRRVGPCAAAARTRNESSARPSRGNADRTASRPVCGRTRSCRDDLVSLRGGLRPPPAPRARAHRRRVAQPAKLWLAPAPDQIACVYRLLNRGQNRIIRIGHIFTARDFLNNV